MKPFCNLARAAILAAVGVALMPAQPLRVGTFHKSSVVVAFYRSPQWAETLRAKGAELEAAKKANDTEGRGAECVGWRSTGIGPSAISGRGALHQHL